MRSKRKVFWFRFLFSLLFLFSGSLGLLLWTFGSAFIGPFPYANQPVPNDLPVEIVDFRDEAGTQLKGWLIQGEEGKGIVLILHGHGGHKSMSLGRVRFLKDAGYSVFVFDFQGHGESEAKYVTVGYEEARNVRAALNLIRKRFPGEKVAVIGPSLGGAALLVKGQVVQADAFVLEGVYTSLARTGENRLAHLVGGSAAKWLMPLLIKQTAFRLGFDADFLEPLSTISELKGPVFIIGGGADPFVLPEDTQALYERAGEPKELWMIEGAGHYDFYLYSPEEYKKRVLDFLGRHL